MGHSNQSGNFWQGEICAMTGDIRAMWKMNFTKYNFAFAVRCLHNV